MEYSKFLRMLYELRSSNWFAVPTTSMKKGTFIKHSLRRWALSEVIEYAKEKHKLGWDPVYIMEQFCKMMDEFAFVDKEEDLEENLPYTFSIAYDVGMEILDMLLV